jgi:hypothetical protein
VAIVTAIRALLSRIATALKTLSDKEGLFVSGFLLRFLFDTEL